MVITEAQKRNIYKYIEKNKDKILENTRLREKKKWDTDQEFKERKKLAMKAYRDRIKDDEELYQQKKEYQRLYRLRKTI